MNLHDPITEDLISVLDRVLDKSIVVESWIHISLQEREPVVVDANTHRTITSVRIETASVYIGYGSQGHWQEGKGFEDLFPYWRRDLWTK